MEPLAARYIEVLRGSNALGVGSSSLGGAINYVSLNGYESSGPQVRVEGGSFGYLRGRAGFGGSSGKTDYVVNLTHSSQDGFREHAEQNSQRLFANFGIRPRDDRETRFYVTAVRNASELPGNLTKTQLESDASQVAAGNVALDQRRDFDLFRLANRTSFRLGDQRRVDVGAYWSYKSMDHPIFQVLDQVSHDVGVDFRYESEAELAGRSNRLVLGVSPSIRPSGGQPLPERRREPRQPHGPRRDGVAQPRHLRGGPPAAPLPAGPDRRRAGLVRRSGSRSGCCPGGTDR